MRRMRHRFPRFAPILVYDRMEVLSSPPRTRKIKDRISARGGPI